MPGPRAGLQRADVQPRTPGDVLEAGDRLELVTRDRLLGHPQVLGDVLVRRALDEEQFDAAYAVVIAALEPLSDEVPQGVGQQTFLRLPALAAAGDARRGPIVSRHFIERAAVIVGAELI